MHSSQKKIALLTYGSRGDVEPFLALASGLIAAGYQVRVAGPAPFAPLAGEFGIPYDSIPGNPAELARFFAETAGSNYLKMVSGMVSHVLPLAKTAFEVVRESVKSSDLIIHSFLMMDAGHTFARIQGIPDISAQLFPIFLPTRNFPSIGFPKAKLGGGYNLFSHHVNNFVFSQGARLLFRKLRSNNPDWPELAPWPFKNTQKTILPVLFGFSSQVVPRPSDWPEIAHITGYWKLPPSKAWEPPRDLVGFLQNGTPPAFYSPGSMRSGEIRHIVNDLISCARKHHYRVILTLDEELIPANIKGEDIYFATEIPHAWLFPQTSVIIHHGGAGTTGAAIMAGIPSIAIPFSADQFFWADRLDQLHVGPHSISASKVSPGTVDTVFAELKTGKDFYNRASQLGVLVRNERGLDNAVRSVQKIIEGEEVLV